MFLHTLFPFCVGRVQAVEHLLGSQQQLVIVVESLTKAHQYVLNPGGFPWLIAAYIKVVHQFPNPL